MDTVYVQPYFRRGVAINQVQKVPGLVPRSSPNYLHFYQYNTKSRSKNDRVLKLAFEGTRTMCHAWCAKKGYTEIVDIDEVIDLDNPSNQP